jgi:hypothetical protein
MKKNRRTRPEIVKKTAWFCLTLMFFLLSEANDKLVCDLVDLLPILSLQALTGDVPLASYFVIFAYTVLITGYWVALKKITGYCTKQTLIK